MPKKRKDCGAEGCPNEHYAHGYCQRHYMQVKKYGRLTPELEHRMDSVCVEVDRPAKVVKAKPARLSRMTIAQLVCSTTDVFWWWSRENPIGWPRAEKSRLRVGK